MRHTRRRLTTLLLAAITALAGMTVIAAPAQATPVTTIGDFEYTYDPLNVSLGATVIDYTGGPSATIPPQVTIEGVTYDVTEIGDSAFMDNALTAVTIPEGVKTIGAFAFASNQLTGVEIPSTATSIGDYAFEANQLATATLGTSLTTIGVGAFQSNVLTSVTVPASVTSISQVAFDANPGLTSVRFLGDAPSVFDPGADESFESTDPDLLLHYTSGAAGFTSPTWHGYNTVAGASVGTIADLQSATAPCSGSIAVTLTADIDAPTDELNTSCNVDLDLNGFELTLRNIVIDSGTLTIDDTATGGTLTVDPLVAGLAGIRTTGANLIIKNGTISAIGSNGGAGIGGGSGQAGGTVEISGGHVTAVSPAGGAGIGGGSGGDGGSTTITGGQVTADAGTYGSGIGGGIGSSGGTTTISGGEVTATAAGNGAGIGSGGSGGTGGTTTVSGGTVKARGGNEGGAGIGGGTHGDGGAVTIGTSADVTAIGNSAIGFGGGGSAFGSLAISGILRIPTGTSLTVPTAVTIAVASTGTVTGISGSAAGGIINGDGTIGNAGRITLPTNDVTATVKDHHYLVTFDPQGGSSVPAQTVFAKSFADGARTLPTPTKSGFLFDGWNNGVGGPGSDVGANTTLAGSSADGTPVEITLYAQWIPEPIAGLDPTITGTVREGQTLTAHTGTVTPGTTTFTYQWKANGTNISGATNPTLRLGRAQAGRRISVTITGTAPGVDPVPATSASTGVVSSPYSRLILSTKTVKKGQIFKLVATGLKPGQNYTVWLGGKKTNTGKADATGTVSRTAKFPSSIKAGTRRVRVSGYNSKGKRTYTVYTSVTYKK